MNSPSGCVANAFLPHRDVDRINLPLSPALVDSSIPVHLTTTISSSFAPLASPPHPHPPPPSPGNAWPMMHHHHSYENAPDYFADNIGSDGITQDFLSTTLEQIHQHQHHDDDAKDPSLCNSIDYSFLQQSRIPQHVRTPECPQPSSSVTTDVFSCADHVVSGLHPHAGSGPTVYHPAPSIQPDLSEFLDLDDPAQKDDDETEEAHPLQMHVGQFSPLLTLSMHDSIDIHENHSLFDLTLPPLLCSSALSNTPTSTFLCAPPPQDCATLEISEFDSVPVSSGTTERALLSQLPQPPSTDIPVELHPYWHRIVGTPSADAGAAILDQADFFIPHMLHKLSNTLNQAHPCCEQYSTPLGSSSVSNSADGITLSVSSEIDEVLGIVHTPDAQPECTPSRNSGELLGGCHAYRIPNASESAPLQPVRAEKSEFETRTIQKLVTCNNLSADASEEIPNPPELTVELLRHQKRAVAWMRKREQLGTSPMVDRSEDMVNLYDHGEDEMDSFSENPNEPCRGGILADEQGLGKTLTVISLLLTNLPPKVGKEKPKCRTLIVCPVSLVGQWRDEMERRIRPEHCPSIYIYHGPKRTRLASDLASYDVVITTYQTVTLEYPKPLKEDPSYAEAKKTKTPLPRRQGGPIFQCCWFRVVLDEAHNIKNRRTECWAAANQISAERRWCLTGTPIQNSVDDIYSLFCFIRYRFMRVNNYKHWNEKWKKKLENGSAGSRERAFKQFQTIVGVVTLRRTKADTIDGKPLISIPDRNCEVREVAFRSTWEMELYRDVEKTTLAKLRGLVSNGDFRQHYSGIILLLLRLRQACCHPHLMEYASVKAGVNKDEGEDFCTHYSSRALDETKELLEAGESTLASLPEAVQNVIMKKLAPPSQATSEPPVYECEECRVHYQFEFLQVSAGGKIMCRGCSSTVLTQNTEIGAANNHHFLELNDLCREVHVKAREERRRSIFNTKRACTGAKRGKRRGGDVTIIESNRASTKKLRVDELTDVCSADMKSEVHSGDNSSCVGIEVPSTKIKIILEILQAMHERDETEKCLIFSQWTSMINIIAFHLGQSGFSSCRLDGSMSMAQRKEEIDRFKYDKSVKVFLISMHAGGTGLNLTEASNVILADVWWNPSVEEQCCDRAHRIGQTKVVRVTRLKISGTVEERIYEMCQRKAELCKGSLGAGGSQSLGRQKMTLEDAMNLFGDVAEHVVQNGGVDEATRQMALDISRFVGTGQHLTMNSH